MRTLPFSLLLFQTEEVATEVRWATLPHPDTNSPHILRLLDSPPYEFCTLYFLEALAWIFAFLHLLRTQ